MKVCLYLGVFDPITLGHISLVNQVIEELNIDRFIIFPIISPKHKPNATPFEHRYKMVELAIKEVDKVEVSILQPIEGSNFKSIFQIIRKNYPNDDIYYLQGADTFIKNNEIDKIIEFATPIVATREGMIANDVFQDEFTNITKGLSKDIIVIEEKLKYCSSTFIRDNIFNETNIKKFILEDVYQYIIKNALYASAT